MATRSWRKYWERILHWHDDAEAPLDDLAPIGIFDEELGSAAMYMARTSWILFRRQVRTNAEAQHIASRFPLSVSLMEVDEATYTQAYYEEVASLLFRFLCDYPSARAATRLAQATRLFCSWTNPEARAHVRSARNSENARVLRHESLLDELREFAVASGYPQAITREKLANRYKEAFSLKRPSVETLKRYIDQLFPVAAVERSKSRSKRTR